MRNQEAARYARWAAMAAGAIALVVVGVYAERAIRNARRHHETPAAVPATVQQQTQTFTYKRVEKDRTIFTIRASRATQFKEGDQALLEDVWITIYGRQGDRNDNIHTRECSYNQKTGSVQCKGELTIDVQGANPALKTGARTKVSAAIEKPMSIHTSNLTFDGQTGEASTPAAVDFKLPQGHGHGVGVVYSTQTDIVRVEHAVEFEATPSERTSGQPVNLSGSSLEVRRNDRIVILTGPATVRQGDRELAADKISVDLDENFRAKHVIADGHPSIRGSRGTETFNVSASSFEGFLNPEGWVQRLVADGGVTATSKSATGANRFSSARVDVSLEPKHNMLREMNATGNVIADAQEGAASRRLQTNALRVKFASADNPEHQHVQSAETLAPAMLESKADNATTDLRAPKFNAQFTSRGRLERLVGAGGVQVQNQAGNSAAQVTTAEKFDATFAQDGQWNTVEEDGGVHFQQAERQATAAHASIDRASDQVVLTGSPVLMDSMSRTTARTVTIGQKSGEIDARGGVVSTYMPASHSDAVNLGTGLAHITAQTLSGSSTSGQVVYSGHARIWQGDSVLDADQITLWRDEKKMQATGNVVAVFPQSSGPTLKAVSQSKASSNRRVGPSLWHLRAPSLTYWSEQNKARLEGGVTAKSEQGSLESRMLDVYLGSGASNATSQSTEHGPVPATGQLTRVVAQGGVLVSQDDRHGSAEQAEYTAADQRFVMSGGQPTLTDASGNTTTGRSLTFFVASDTILIDSQAGSRTLTRHRVEK